MKEIPILFSTPMAQAILDGRKIMTRRVVKNLPECALLDMQREPQCQDSHMGEWLLKTLKCPYGQPGDRLWVRETWAPGEYCQIGGYVYRADYADKNPNCTPGLGKWKPSIHMPKAAARIWLEVTDVRVERLQEITEEDAKAEGCASGLLTGTCSARGQFELLWDSLNAKRGYGWDTNPWLWVVSFRRVQP